MFPVAPWLTRRDELNVMEEEFDELCRRHEKVAGDDAWEAEETVIREQAEAEDAMEAELTGRVGPEWLEPAEGCGHDHSHEGHDHGHFPETPLIEALRRDLDRDPAYQQALTWAAAAYRWSRSQYARERHPHLFRASVNACLVPMKVSYALNELMFDDPYSADVADKEFELATTYLSRARVSLAALAAEGMLEGDQVALLERAEDVARDIREARECIARERKFRKNGDR